MIEDAGTFGKNGQADAIFLQTLDVNTGKTVIIGISRDSMVDIDVYSMDGNFIRTDHKQLCLAYAYGDGKKTSCDNVIKSVSRLLYGMPIEFYCAMDLEPIGKLNDAVGGVTVKALEDITLSGGLLKKGETITLRGDDAKTYVQQRDISAIDSNMPRMKRQQQYLTAFAQSALRMTKRDVTTPVKLLNRFSQYITTNLDASKITYLTTSVLTNNSNGEFDFRMVQGKVFKGEKYAEFVVDETALYELILDVFYNKVA
jgi:polyisoprenyl-teichoic acid--peptidoglycan teichoic acid transferase